MMVSLQSFLKYSHNILFHIISVQKFLHIIPFGQSTQFHPVWNSNHGFQNTFFQPFWNTNQASDRPYKKVFPPFLLTGGLLVEVKSINPDYIVCLFSAANNRRKYLKINLIKILSNATAIIYSLFLPRAKECKNSSHVRSKKNVCTELQSIL